MKTILRLAVLALAGTAALALAGNALATQKLSVSQTTTSLTIKVSQTASDPQPAKITVYIPSGYTVNTTQATGTTIGSTKGTVLARDAGNISLPLAGDVIVQSPAAHVADRCSPGNNQAVWLLDLQVAGQKAQIPVYVNPTTGAAQALGAFRLDICLGPDDVPAGTPGRSPNGAHLLDATFTVQNVFTVATGQAVWKAITTPYTPSIGAPNPGGTVETRAIVSEGTVTIAGKVTSKARRLLRLTGSVTQAGAAIAGTQVSILVDGKARFRARTNATGKYSVVLRKTGKKRTTTIFQARVSAGERDVTTTGCASPTPGVPGGCVSATASAFTAVSSKIKIRL